MCVNLSDLYESEYEVADSIENNNVRSIRLRFRNNNHPAHNNHRCLFKTQFSIT